MRALPSILSLFPNELNKFNNTGAGMLVSIYHTNPKLLRNHFCIWDITAALHYVSKIVFYSF